ncbi:homoserine kinase [Paraferrimonas haliotis]|uniref:Homoserine kinase n=1 Tax=Paraferrimonas haliotis TaxID=2013866 RepID=A0AA37TTL4_9GAMM|nr:homoserine kinase [Paraferrimonas haliotis]GLS82540.1 homoserine kinase [Paraferrimonas haliotis]
MSRKVSAYAPASMGNLGVGFDLLGAALAPVTGEPLGDVVTVERSAVEHGLELSVDGEWSDALPLDPQQNIVLKCAQAYYQKAADLGLEITAAPIKLSLTKNLPVGSGLGSSASSVVAALAALNGYYNNAMDKATLLQLMGELEGQISGSIHFDNVAPSYLGGIQLMVGHGDEPSVTVPSFDDWYWLIAYPGISLSTATMRSLLPEQVTLPTTISYGQNLAAFIHASHSKNSPLALANIQDVLAEPYRAEHIPGFVAARAALLELGMSCCSISGSGPTLFSVCRDLSLAEQGLSYLKQHYLQSSQGFAYICRLDPNGCQLEYS